MSTQWIQRRERSNRFFLRLIRFMGLSLPRRALTPLLHLITLFFYLRSVEERKSSRRYLQRVLDRPVRWWHTYQHFYTFAATLLDRIYFLTGRLQAFHIQTNNAEMVAALRKQPAQIWLGAHFGNLDAMRVLAAEYPEFHFRIVMKVEQNATLVGLLNELNPTFREMVIPFRGLGTIFEIAEALDQQTTVALLNDRVVEEAGSKNILFIDKETPIPDSAVQLALKYQLPLVQFFPIYLGAQRYKLIFIPLSTHERTVEQILTEYMRNLEILCRRYPYNWFNFFDYWHDDAI
jgi:predicted LPLAT superfamily acyltransferase